MFLPGVKNIFASRTQILRPKHMFPSLATPGNLTGQAFTIPLSDELVVILTLIVIIDSTVYNFLFCRFSPLCCVSKDSPGFYGMFGFT